MSIRERFVRFILKYFVKILCHIDYKKFFFILFLIKRICKEEIKMKNALIVYFSQTQNTEKVALAIKRGLEKNAWNVTLKKIHEIADPDFYFYDFVCFGSPVTHSLPPLPVLNFIKKYKKQLLDKGEVFYPCPKLPNKHGLVFVTYSGPHCGISEALPVGKYICQFFKHLGFNIIDEWYEIGEFHGWEKGSIKGMMGDIRGRPNEEDLALVELKTIQLTKKLC